MLDSSYNMTLRLLLTPYTPMDGENKAIKTKKKKKKKKKITLKSHFCRKNDILLSLCTQRSYGLHNVSQNDKPLAWRYITHTRTRRHMIKCKSFDFGIVYH